MAISAFPCKYKERQGYLNGPGLNITFAKFPLPDLRAMGIKWVRIDATGVVTSAAIDELIAYYEGGGFRMDWILPVTPVTAGVYFVPSVEGKLICARYAAAGIKQPFLELGNEVLQLNSPGSASGNIVFTVTAANATANATYTNNGQTFTVAATITGATTLVCNAATGDPAASGTLTKASGTGDATITFSAVSYAFTTEAAARTAYATCMASFVSAMGATDYIFCACNDEPPFVYRMITTLQQAGGAPPDLWGIHGYSVSTASAGSDGAGTFDLMQEITQSSIVLTEGNKTGVTIAKVDAEAYFKNMTANMGNRPWCYFDAGDTGYDATTDAFAWYNVVGAPDPNGIATYSGRTATLTETATNMGITLP